MAMNYWQKRQMSRRSVLRTSALGVAGLGSAIAVGCGGDDDDSGSESPTTASGGSTTTAGSPTAIAGSPVASTEGKPGGRLRTANTGPEGPLTLDPHTQESAFSQISIRPMYNNLIKYTEPDAPGQWVLTPELADSWEQPDELTTTFKIHPGVKFHDLAPVNGRELTADDIVYSFDRMRTDDPRFVLRSTFATIEKIEAVDANTVRITTPFPFAPLLHNLAFPWASVVAREVVESGDIENSPVGTGPWQLAEYQRGASIRYVRNPNYFKPGLPYADEYEQPIMGDRAARLAALRAGELDLEGILSAQIPDLEKSNPEIIIHKRPTVSGAVIRFNCANPLFKDERVRQAIAYATHPQDYIDIIANGDGIRHGPMPLAIAQWAVDESMLPPKDLAKAKQLLEAAGVSNLKIKSLSTAAYDPGFAYAEIMVSQMAEIGVTVEVDPVDNAVWIDRSYRADSGEDFEFSIYGDYSYSDPDRGLRDHYHSEGANNNHNFSDPALDKLLDDQRGTLDSAERQKIVLEAQKILIEKAPRVWLFSSVANTAVQPWLKNYVPRVSEATNNMQDYEQMWLDKA